ncbi:MAG: hypothetical protein IJV22_05330 [Bacteroidales bacterium]|nr:hypothetical protein [Bacteroidales bacterium]
MNRYLFPVILGLALLLSMASCVKDPESIGISKSIVYSGQLYDVEAGNYVSNAQVSLYGNGQTIGSVVTSDAQGRFNLKVDDILQVSSSTKLRITTGGTFEPLSVSLVGLGNPTYSYGRLSLYRPGRNYSSLAYFTFSGLKYKVAPISNAQYQYSSSGYQSFISSANIGGYTDWDIPTLEQAQAMGEFEYKHTTTYNIYEDPAHESAIKLKGLVGIPFYAYQQIDDEHIYLYTVQLTGYSDGITEKQITSGTASSTSAYVLLVRRDS